MIIVLSTGDIHSPEYLEMLVMGVEKHCSSGKPDIILLTGDFVKKGKAENMKAVIESLRKCGDAPVIAVFGNEDYEESRSQLKRIASGYRFLEDEILRISVGETVFEILGTTGILDEPTRWQARNIPGIREIYRKRLELLENFSSRRKEDGVTRIFLTHYPPTYRTLVGEPRFAWPQMGSRRAEEIIKRTGTIDYVIHGHAHKSRVHETRIGRTIVLNTSLPARRDLVEIKVHPKKDLLSFFG